MYGSRWYEYKNTVIFGNKSYGSIDSIDLMTRFRPKDVILIQTKYIMTVDQEKKILDIGYIRQ